MNKSANFNNLEIYREYIQYLPGKINLSCKTLPDKFLIKDINLLKDRIYAAFLGVLLGDLAGSYVEGLSPQEIKEKYSFLDYFLEGSKLTDDTQLTLWYLSSLIKNENFNPEDIAYNFAFKGDIINAGKTIKKFLYNYRIEELPWYKCGLPSAGNGAVMRVLPASIWHIDNLCLANWQSAIQSIITHNDEMAIASCVLFTSALWHNFRLKKDFFESYDNIKLYFSILLDNIKGIEENTIYKDSKGNITNLYNRFKEVLYFIDFEKDDFSYILKVREILGNNAYVLETLPFVFFLAFQTKFNFKKALWYGVNCGSDSDTIAALTSSLILSFKGKEVIDKDYIKVLKHFKEYNYILELLDIYFDTRFKQLV